MGRLGANRAPLGGARRRTGRPVCAGLLACRPRCRGVHPPAVGYGEVWRDGAEAEIARVIVAPAERGRGLGRVLVSELAARARATGLSPVWIRLHEDNDAALACYAAAGFRRIDQAAEAEFNAGQPRRYVWMRA